MTKKPILSILTTLFICCIIAGSSITSPSKKNRPLTDSFVLAGANGRLFITDNNDGNGIGATERWFFEFDSEISDAKGLISAGTAIEMMPSSTLEKMISVTQKHPAAIYRLWGRISEYKGRNFIFAVYFLPVSKVNSSRNQSIAQQSDSQPSKQIGLTVNEPNDVLEIPEEIITKLKMRKIVRIEKLQNKLELKTDFILANRTGFIHSSINGTSLEEDILTLDALGQNLEQISFKLLPCQILESAMRRQSFELEPLRFNVAGIVTQYKGQNYLLLQRAIPVYSYGNFNR